MQGEGVTPQGRQTRMPVKRVFYEVTLLEQPFFERRLPLKCLFWNRNLATQECLLIIIGIVVFAFIFALVPLHKRLVSKVNQQVLL